MNSKEIRKKYINFFRKRGHVVIPSSSLIPENDPTLLFVNSGMFPLVPYFLGENHPQGKKLVNFQRSFRSDDIDEVGDGRHTTFFEMLGNWSFGEYFKRDQLFWWFEFLIEELSFDINKIYQTVYSGDDKTSKDNDSVLIIKEIYEKYGISIEDTPKELSKINFRKHKIFSYKEKNWWQRGDSVGELGGPDSETFYDTGKKHDPSFGNFCHPNCDCGRFIEIGNSVFMQYQKEKIGWNELKNKNVDFGGGLERLSMISEGLNSVFETDLFFPIIQKIEKISGKKYKENFKEFEIIADHIKAAVFLIGDERGVIPSNKQQGYYVRRLIRRSIRYGRQIGINGSWLDTLLDEIIDIYKDYYPELERNRALITKELKKEEDAFNKTITKGLKEFEKLINKKKISGKDLFNLYQTYGFPIEITKELAEERNQEIDEEGFKKELENHKKLSQTASAGLFKGGLADSKESTTKLHTATHLLLSALRIVLKENITQKGSNINSDRLRFDFSYSKKITDEELSLVEGIINDKIKSNLKVVRKEMKLKDALKSGALSFFGERYPEIVTVYSIEEESGIIFSKEICRGPHVKRTSEIGGIKITKEEASSSGVRRIRAVLS
jgi:alanyl-tRNA synthetase